MNMILGKMMPVFAQAGQGQPGPQFWTQLPILGLLVVIFYFALIRPQQKKAKEQAEMLKSVRRGDKIVTSGGIIATVVNVTDKAVSVRSADSKFEIIKSAITQITERSGEESSS